MDLADARLAFSVGPHLYLHFFGYRLMEIVVVSHFHDKLVFLGV